MYNNPTDQSKITSKAIIRASIFLEIENDHQAKVMSITPNIACCPDYLSGLLKYNFKIHERSLLFLRRSKELNNLSAGDTIAASSWLNSNNTKLQHTPINMTISPKGLESAILPMESTFGQTLISAHT